MLPTSDGACILLVGRGELGVLTACSILLLQEGHRLANDFNRANLGFPLGTNTIILWHNMCYVHMSGIQYLLLITTMLCTDTKNKYLYGFKWMKDSSHYETLYTQRIALAACRVEQSYHCSKRCTVSHQLVSRPSLLSQS